jgi:MFS family permease
LLRVTSARGAQSASLRWWPPGVYYGWALVGALGLTATVSYGILSYAFTVFVEPMTRDLGWSKATVTGAFSFAALVAGAAALPVGRWVDRHGARVVMTGGSVLATVGLVGWSRIESVAEYYAVWGLLGLAMAAVLYEPAFAVVAVWFRERRARALTLLTFVGGFASVVFVPVAGWLVTTVGWREALGWLALVYGTLTIVPHAVLLRRRPSDLGLRPDGKVVRAGASSEPVELSVPPHIALRSPAFRWLTVAFALSSLTTAAVSVHLVPLLLERGFDAGFAAGAMGLLGLMALPGRLVFTPLGSRLPRAGVTASIFLLQALACLAMLESGSTTAVWVFVVLFGAGFGAITPARAALIADTFGPSHFGRISGVLALWVALARAVGPVGASWIYSAAEESAVGYRLVLGVLAGACLTAGGSVLLTGARVSGRRSRLDGTLHAERGFVSPWHGRRGWSQELVRMGGREHPANRGDPIQPMVLPEAPDHRRAERPCRIHAGAGKRPTHECAKPDGEAYRDGREALGHPAIGRHGHDHEHESE